MRVPAAVRRKLVPLVASCLIPFTEDLADLHPDEEISPASFALHTKDIPANDKASVWLSFLLDKRRVPFAIKDLVADVRDFLVFDVGPSPAPPLRGEGAQGDPAGPGCTALRR